MLGLRHDQNLLVDYDPDWSSLFAEERDRLQSALFHVLQGIEHYGSTAVPGLRAKPIIDILVGILPLRDWVRCKQPLESLDYDYAEHAGVPGHYIFGRGRDLSERTHLVHLVEFNGPSWRSNLAFRDALRASQQLREEYLAAKEAAVQSAPEGRAKYNELKQIFFDRLNLV
ncbi:MAG: GrpB family protein [Caldilinea sp.]|nr:GrpB family protein [Caldilinea sp.]